MTDAIANDHAKEPPPPELTAAEPTLAPWVLWGAAALAVASLVATLLPWDDLAMALNLRTLLR